MTAAAAHRWVIATTIRFWPVNRSGRKKRIEMMWAALIHFTLLFLNISVWAVKYRDLRNELRLLGFLLLITFLVEGYATYLMLHDTRNLYLYHLLTPVQYVLYAGVFRMALQTGWVKRLITLSVPAFLLACLLVTLYVQGTSEYNSYALMLKSFFITGWVLCYFVEAFSTLKLGRIETEPMFWVCTGLLFYSLGSFFLEGLMNYLLLQEHAYTLNLYYASLVLGYLLYSAYIVALTLEKQWD